MREQMSVQHRMSKASKEFSNHLAAACKIQSVMRNRAAKRDKQAIGREMRDILGAYHQELLHERGQRESLQRDANRALQEASDYQKSLKASQLKQAEYQADAKAARLEQAKAEAATRHLTKELSKKTRETKDEGVSPMTAIRDSDTTAVAEVSKTDAHGNNGIAAKSVLGGSPIHMDRLNQGLALGVSLMFCLASMCFFIARQMFVSEQCILECAGADIPYGV